MNGMHGVPPQNELLERMSDGFVALDREWRFIYINAAAERTMRRPRADVLGKICWDEYPELRGTEIEAQYRRAMRDQVPLAFERHNATLGVWALVSVYPSETGLSVYFQDITARKTAELALAETQARYKLIVETANEGIWLADAEYRTVWANERMRDILGHAPDELVGRRVQEFVYEEDLPELRRQMEARKQGKSAQYDIRMKHATRGLIWAMAKISPILGPDGTFAGALGMLTDITDRKFAEGALLEQREWFRVTLSSIGDAVIATDATGRITFMNSVAEELTKWSNADAAGRALTEVFRIVNEHTREPVEDPVAKVLRENRVVGLANHTALIARDGSECPIDDSGAPIRGKTGEIRGVVLVFRDNTERARAEKALRDADRRKDEFLAMLAHELRNPLAPIRSALEVMRLRPEESESLARARAIVERQVAHMSRLVDDLLDVSRITRGQITLRKELVDVSALMARAAETIGPQIAQRRQRLEVNPPAEALVADVDATRFAQVLSNLLHNASKFTPDGGRIELAAERKGGELEIRVSDDGIGIAPADLPSIFEPFTQLHVSIDRSQGGLGIGLSLVKRLVELHQGAVEARSAGAGKGSTFLLRIPLPAAGASGRPATPAFRASETKWRVFVVDDNVDAAETLSMLLTILGHEVRTETDALAALRRIPEWRPDIVLLDIGLPRMNGYELARTLRADPSLASLFLLAVSGYGQDEDMRRSREAGFDGHLVKPVSVEALQQTFEDLTSARTTKRA